MSMLNQAFLRENKNPTHLSSPILPKGSHLSQQDHCLHFVGSSPELARSNPRVMPVEKGFFSVYNSTYQVILSEPVAINI